MQFENFGQLDDEDNFVQVIMSHYTTAFEEFAAYADCEPEIDEQRVRLAHGGYVQQIDKYRVMLDSKNPDQYKRSAALLHCLYQSDPVVGVKFNELKFDELEMNGGVGLSYEDSQFKLKAIEFYKLYTNEILEFDLSFRCCEVYEDTPKSYTFDYLENMAFYLKNNTSLSVHSFAMIFKAYMT